MIFMTYNSPNRGIYGDIVRVRLDRGSMLSLALVCLSLNFCPTFLFLFFAYDIGKLYSKYDYVGAYVCVCVCVCVCVGMGGWVGVGVCVCGSVGVWMCGCVGVWVCGCVGV